MEKDEVKYPHNVLEGFANGCLLDFRARVALQLLTSSPVFQGVALGTQIDRAPQLPKYLAGMALELADELLKQAAEKGWVDPIPNNDEISASLRKQARRTAEYQVQQQLHGNRIAQEEQSGRVVPVAPQIQRGH